MPNLLTLVLSDPSSQFFPFVHTPYPKTISSSYLFSLSLSFSFS